MPAKRVKRPKLDRDRPDRKWPTLFRAGAKENDPPVAAAPRAPSAKEGERAALSDAVDLSYRVIDDYLKQSRQAAQAFSPSSWMPGSATGTPASSTDDMQQMAQRVMQYGWDFFGLWFEMWSKMGAGGAWPVPPGGRAPAATSVPAPDTDTRAPGVATTADAGAEAEALVVAAESVQPITTSAQLRPGPNGELTIHALRPRDHDGPPIKNVTIERSEEDGGWLVRVKVPAGQRPDVYRAPIIDAATNLPRGTLTVRVKAATR